MTRLAVRSSISHVYRRFRICITKRHWFVWTRCMQIWNTDYSDVHEENERKASARLCYVTQSQTRLSIKRFQPQEMDPFCNEMERHSSRRIITMITTEIIRFYETSMRRYSFIRLCTDATWHWGVCNRFQLTRCLFIKAIAMPFHHASWVRTNERTWNVDEMLIRCIAIVICNRCML